MNLLVPGFLVKSSHPFKTLLLSTGASIGNLTLFFAPSVEQNMKRDVSLDFQFKSPIEQVWTALTDSNTLAKWVMDNDFKPIVGHKFQFRTEPSQWWDGIVNCEVLEVDEHHRLSYTWVSGSESTTVTWILKKAEYGTTHLYLDQTGFSGAEQAFNGAIYGWQRMANQLEQVLAEL